MKKKVKISPSMQKKLEKLLPAQHLFQEKTSELMELLDEISTKEEKEIDVSQELKKLHQLLKQNYQKLKDSKPGTGFQNLKNVREQVAISLRYLLGVRLLDEEIVEFWRQELRGISPQKHPFYFKKETLDSLRKNIFRKVVAYPDHTFDQLLITEYLAPDSPINVDEKIYIMEAAHQFELYNKVVQIGESIKKNKLLEKQSIVVSLLLWDSYYKIYLEQVNKQEKILRQGVEFLIAACEKKCDDSLSKGEKDLYYQACYMLGNFYCDGLNHEQKKIIIPVNFKKAKEFLKKTGNNIKAQLDLAVLYLRLKDDKNGVDLLKKIMEKNIYPENMLALIILADISIFRKLKTEVSQLLVYFEGIRKKINEDDNSFPVSLAALNKTAVQYYLTLYYQSSEKFEREKYVESARQHLKLIKNKSESPRALLLENILNNLDNENSKEFVMRQNDHKKQVILGKNIGNLLYEYKDTFKDFEPDVKTIVNREICFSQIAKGILSIKNREDFNNLYQYSAWRLLLICLEKTFSATGTFSNGILFLELINKLKIYPGHKDSLVANIVVSILTTNNVGAIYPENMGLDRVAQYAYLLAQIGPVFSPAYCRELIFLFETISFYCRKEERNASPKNSCLILYSISLLHVSLSQEEKSYEYYLFCLLEIAKKLAQFIYETKSNLKRIDLNQVKRAVFYFLGYYRGRKYEKIEEINNVFFRLLQNLSLLAKEDKDLRDAGDEVKTSSSQYRFYQKILPYFERAVEEEKIELKAGDRTISHHLDIYVSKNTGQRQKVKGIEFDGPSHLKFTVIENRSEKDPDLKEAELHKSPPTLMRDALIKLYYSNKVTTVSVLDPDMPDLFAPETLEIRIAWFRFLMLKLDCHPTLFFLKLPIKFQSVEPWRADPKPRDKVLSYLSYQDLHLLLPKEFSNIIESRKRDYGFKKRDYGFIKGLFTIR
jgi:hypothetical protein